MTSVKSNHFWFFRSTISGGYILVPNYVFPIEYDQFYAVMSILFEIQF